MDRSESILRRHHVTVSGRGTQPMLFAHGFGCDQNMWRFVAPAFEDDYRVVLFDYAGCGRSESAAYDIDRHAALAGYADDVIDICEALDLHDVVFVGHSVSSMIGVLASIRNPGRFARLILIGPSPRYLDDPPYVGGFDRASLESLLEMMERNTFGWAGMLAPVVMKNPDKPELTHELEASFCAMEPLVARRFAEVTFFSDNRADLSLVPVPSLVMQCSDDAIAPAAVGRYVAASLPRSTFVTLRATGHCPHLSHPEETIAVMKRYLSAPAGNGEE